MRKSTDSDNQIIATLKRNETKRNETKREQRISARPVS